MRKSHPGARPSSGSTAPGLPKKAWPFWKLGGVLGLYAWRWLTTLAVFGLAWAAARRMGAKGLVTFTVIALCALIYRGRTQVRPETVAAALREMLEKR